MKNKKAVFFRLFALIVIVFLGISAVIPQETGEDNEVVIPVWSDVSENDEYVKTVFIKGIIEGSEPNYFGVNDAFKVSEGAYAALRLYEDENGIEHSFESYSAEDCENYIQKASEYGIWSENISKEEGELSRRTVAEVLAPLVDGVDNEALKECTAMGAYEKSVLKLYNQGIALDGNIMNAFSENVITKGEAAKLVVMYLVPNKRIKVSLPDFDALKAELEGKMAEYQGDWSLYFEDCNTGCVISINSHQVYSASLIKLFVAQTVYERASAGTLSLSQKTEEEIRKMITYSDNDSWKYLARLLGGGSYSSGMSAVTNSAKAAGFADTGQFYQGSHKNYNFTSVNDCGKFLRGVLNGTIVSPEYSEKILSLLKQQQHTQKIPAGVPDGVQTANKTGELDYIQGDAAIVYAPSGTYILVVIGDSLTNGYGQIDKITHLSETVYNFLNN